MDAQKLTPKPNSTAKKNKTNGELTEKRKEKGKGNTFRKRLGKENENKRRPHSHSI